MSKTGTRRVVRKPAAKPAAVAARKHVGAHVPLVFSFLRKHGASVDVRPEPAGPIKRAAPQP